MELKKKRSKLLIENFYFSGWMMSDNLDGLFLICPLVFRTPYLLVHAHVQGLVWAWEMNKWSAEKNGNGITIEIVEETF